MDYYAVGMGVMYLLFAANSGTESIFEEKRKGTYQRLSIMPVKENSIFSGKVIWNFSFNFNSIYIDNFDNKIFYGVSWGNSFLVL